MAGPGAPGDTRRDAPKRRYYLRRALAAPAQRLSSRFPAWRTLSEIATQARVRSLGVRPVPPEHPGDRTFELCVGGYGPFVADAIASQDRRFTLLDIGANLGLFSLLAARHPQCDRVIAVEPLPHIYRSLEATFGGMARTRSTILAPERDAGGIPPPVLRRPAFRDVQDRREPIRRRPRPGDLGRDAGPPVPRAARRHRDQDRRRGIGVRRAVHPPVDPLLRLHRRSDRGGVGAARGMVREMGPRQMLAQEGFEEMSRSGAPSHYDARYRRARRPRG